MLWLWSRWYGLFVVTDFLLWGKGLLGCQCCCFWLGAGWMLRGLLVWRLWYKIPLEIKGWGVGLQMILLNTPLSMFELKTMETPPIAWCSLEILWKACPVMLTLNSSLASWIWLLMRDGSMVLKHPTPLLSNKQLNLMIMLTGTNIINMITPLLFMPTELLSWFLYLTLN